MSESIKQSNVLGRTSLYLGIASLSLVFGIGLCAIVGNQQGWLPVAATILYVCGASSAFLGFVGFVLGIAGVIGKNLQKSAAIVGLILGVSGVCLFLLVIQAVSGG